MKHSKYIMMSPWDRPETFFWEVPICRDAQGNVQKTVRKPAFIAKYKTDQTSSADGFVVCVRKMELTVPPLKPPQ